MAGSAREFVYGLVAAGILVKAPVGVGAACKAKDGLAQLKIIASPCHSAVRGMGLTTLPPALPPANTSTSVDVSAREYILHSSRLQLAQQAP